MNKKLKTTLMRVISLVLGMILSCATPLASMPGVMAASGSILEIATVPKDGEKMDSEYEFIAKFISGVTEAETFGSGWSEKENSSGVLHYAIIPSNSQKGKIGVRYKNVGVYNGTTIDLKITINDWESYYNTQSNIAYRKNSITHIAQGYNYVDQTWEFVEFGTDDPVDVTGYMTINDIDNSQGIRFDKETSAAIQDVYVSGTDNWIKFDDTNGEYFFYEADNESSDSSDLWAMFTFTYKNSSTLNFRWETDFAGRGSNPNRVVDTSVVAGEMFSFIAKKPLATATLTPDKFVSDSDESLVTSNTLSGRSEEYTYTINHTVPDEWSDFYYSSYIFTDQLPDCLEIQDVTITNLARTDVTSWFDIATNGNLVRASAKAEKLASSSFYYDTYSFEIAVKVKEDADLTEYWDGVKYFTWQNSATVNIDGDEATSNEVTTRLEEEYDKPYVEKYIVSGTNLVEEYKATENGEQITFYGSVYIPITKKYDPIQIVDELHSSLTYKSMIVKASDGTDITDWGDISVKDNVVTFTFKSEYLTSLMGMNLFFYLETTINTGADFSDVTDGKVPNTYYLKLDDDKYNSNTVHVEIDVKDNAIQKAIITKSGEETGLVLTDNTEDIIFNGKIQITNAKKINNVVLEDVLHDAFKYKSMKVYDADGNEITDKGTIKVSGQTVRFTFDTDYAATLVGKEISWKLTVTYIEGSDLSDLVDGKIPNVMSLYVNGDETDSNEVDVTPIPLVDDIVKKVYDADGKETDAIKLDDNDQEITFVGYAQVNNTSKIKNVVLMDILHDAFKYKSMNVYDADGKEISSKGTVSQNGQIIQFVFDSDYAATLVGKEISWKLTVTYIEGSDLSDLTDGKIPNTMSLYVNGQETTSPPVTVEPIPLVDDIVKKVYDADGKETDAIKLSSNSQEISFIGHVQVNNTKKIKEIILEDTLHQAFAYKRMVVYNQDGLSITSRGTIEQDGQTIRFTIPEQYAADLVGQTLTWRLYVSYIEGSDLSGLEDYVIPNTMNLIVNEEETVSPPVTVEPIPQENDIVKKVLDADGKETDEIKLDDNSQEITFRSYVTITNTEKIKEVILEDTLHDAFRFKSLVVYDEAGVNITKYGDIEQDGQTVRFTFLSSYASSLVGKEISWELTVTYIEGSDLSDLENGVIPNVMNLYVNEEETTSPPVTVEPIPMEDEISKVIVGEDDSEITSLVLEDNSQEVTFRSYVTINNTEKIKEVILEDTLHKAFKYKKNSLKVYDAAGTEITEQGETEGDGQTIRFIFSEEYAKKLVGTKISWELTVTYIEGSDLSELNNLAIPNVMKLYVNERETESDEVTVTPIPLENEIVKSIVDQDGNLVTSITLGDNTEVVTFQGTAVVANDAQIETLVLSDAVSEKFIIDESTVKVSTSSGADVTSLGVVSVSNRNELTYTVSGAEAQNLSGETLNWNFEVSYDQDLDFTEDQTETNTMNLAINGEGADSNEVEVTPVLAENPEAEASQTSQGSTPKTGLENRAFLYVVIGILFLLAGLAFEEWHRKKKQVTRMKF